jgi:hypothetical protein
MPSAALLALALASTSLDLRPRCAAFEAGGLDPAALEPGQALPLRAGTLLGEILLQAAWRDFRGQVVAPGRYELRYLLQPRLKEHVGVDAIRDFALLVPPGTSGDWVAASRSVSRTRHPAVLALVAGEAPPAWRTQGCPKGPRFVLEGQPVPASAF